MDAPHIVRVESDTELLSKMRFDDIGMAREWAYEQANAYPPDTKVWVTLDSPGRPLRFFREGN